uniref:Uncharacterized protein n=1 Tax=Phasianus colchicus TaxID=9054 RepID=A0A669QCX5_PHACC
MNWEGGRHPIMPTIMAGKMEMVFPAMYIMNRFIGICFSGPSATSQQRCEETSSITGKMSYLWGKTGISGRSSHIMGEIKVFLGEKVIFLGKSRNFWEK